MANKLVYDNLEISDALGMVSISDFSMEVMPNEHAKASIKGRIDDDSAVVAWKKEQADRSVIIYCNKDGKKEIIFNGLIMDAGVEYINNSMMLTIELISATILLDRKVKSKSFQDVNTTYADTIINVVNDSGKVSCLFRGNEQIKPQKPVIQYAETDWIFAKRLATHLKCSVYAEVSSEIPAMWIGMPESVTTKVFDQKATYKHGLSQNYYLLGGLASGYEKAQFEYFVVEDYENLKLGSQVTFKNQSWYVVEKKARIYKSELLFSYTLAKKEYIATAKQYNPVFAGMSILGDIIEVCGESVKLHLDIDKEQDSGKAYPYAWAPDTGSVMYCMPEKGTTVSLYFSDQDEFTAKAVNCVRHNGDSCSKMSDTNKRTLTTDGGKNLYLNPDSVGFDIEETGLKMDLADDNGISVTSAKMIYIISDKEITLSGKNVYLDTPNEISLVRQ